MNKKNEYRNDLFQAWILFSCILLSDSDNAYVQTLCTSFKERYRIKLKSDETTQKRNKDLLNVQRNNNKRHWWKTIFLNMNHLIRTSKNNFSNLILLIRSNFYINFWRKVIRLETVSGSSLLYNDIFIFYVDVYLKRKLTW